MKGAITKGVRRLKLYVRTRHLYSLFKNDDFEIPSNSQIETRNSTHDIHRPPLAIILKGKGSLSSGSLRLLARRRNECIRLIVEAGRLKSEFLAATGNVLTMERKRIRVAEQKEDLPRKNSRLRRVR